MEVRLRGLQFQNPGVEYNATSGGSQQTYTVVVGTTNQGRTLNMTGETGSVFTIDNPTAVNLQIDIIRGNDTVDIYASFATVASLPRK